MAKEPYTLADSEREAELHTFLGYLDIERNVTLREYVTARGTWTMPESSDGQLIKDFLEWRKKNLSSS